MAAEIGRHCGSTALTYNMHVCSTLWTGALAEDLDMTPAQRAEHESYRMLGRYQMAELTGDIGAGDLPALFAAARVAVEPRPDGESAAVIELDQARATAGNAAAD